MSQCHLLCHCGWMCVKDVQSLHFNDTALTRENILLLTKRGSKYRVCRLRFVFFPVTIKRDSCINFMIMDCFMLLNVILPLPCKNSSHICKYTVSNYSSQVSKSEGKHVICKSVTYSHEDVQNFKDISTRIKHVGGQQEIQHLEIYLHKAFSGLEII